MKKLSILTGLFCIAALSACNIAGLKLQENYNYTAGSTVNPALNKSAQQYLLDRGKTPVIVNDTLFKYMQLGLEYAGFDLTEYAKTGRTFILLANNSIRTQTITTTTVGSVTTTTTTITGGFWFDFPIMDKNPDGSQKFAADGVTPISHAARSWSEYSPATVKNYFLYLIGQGTVGFSEATNLNTGLLSILPAGTVAGKESKIGYLVSSTTQNLSISGARIITYDFVNGGKGFDPESKFNIRLAVSDFTPMIINDNTTVATGGLQATNGLVHVCATTVYPCRY